MEARRMGPFALGEQLGAGGMGVVYRATYVQTGQQVAIKFVPASLLDNERVKARFERELAILKKLRHPNIVRCYGGGLHQGRLYYAMELVEGGSLADILKDRGRLSWETAIQYGQQICSALSHAHDHGIIHRDLKPANLLLTRDGQLKLSDFGLARDNDATALTQTGHAQGTFAYMAPEIIRGKPISHKSDLYSLGCMMFELLTGQRPFSAESPAEVFYQHIEKIPPRVSTLALDCPIWLESLVAQLLEKDPARRPLDAQTVGRALQEVQDKVATQASMAAFSIHGGPTTLSIDRDVTAVRKAIGARPKKKKRDADTPVYERVWFLATSLALLVGIVAWSLWPLGESKLFALAEVKMASSEPLDWKKARDEYLEPYLRRFPDGPHRAQVQTYIDQIEMHTAEQRFKNNVRLGREPRSEGERLFAAAWRYEQFGDQVTALERYQGIIELLKADSADRPFVNLAQRQIAQIQQSPAGAQDRRQLVEAALAQADTLFREGKAVEAQLKWQSIVNLYGGNRELGVQVELARRKLVDPDAAAPQVPEAPDEPADASSDESAEGR